MTTAYAPSLGNLFTSAFGRIGVRPPALTQQHLQDAYNEANFLQADWSADGITWWTVTLNTQALTQGTATYNVVAGTVSVLDVYINNGSSNRLIMPFSRTDYASLANPTTQGFPTSCWWNRVLTPTITLWPVPDGNATYTMQYYTYNQTQDATLGSATAPSIPYFWLDAYVAGLAHRLARLYVPAMEQLRAMDAEKAYMRACKQVETSPLYVTPGLQGYFN